MGNAPPASRSASDPGVSPAASGVPSGGDAHRTDGRDPSSAPAALLPRRLLSVGNKLAGATIALMAAVAAVVYIALSGYQRESLLGAKEMAATAVTRLFADSCAAPIVFGDDRGTKDALATLGRNDDIEYAAVWSTDANGGAGQRLAELARGPAADLSSAPPLLQVRREAERLVLRAPVRDLDSRRVGEVVVTFSINRENAAIVDVEHRTLLASGAIAMVIAALLLGVARVSIVRPLRKLVGAANKIERGDSSEIDVRSNDEIGQLASAFRSMARAIQSREARIRARNHDMRLVLDNVDQGFLTLDAAGRVSQERSRVIDQWFGSPVPEMRFWEYMARIDPRVAEWFEVAWEAIDDDVLPLDVCLTQLPHLVEQEERVLELAYRPILQDGRLDKVLVVITDVTARITRERADATQRDTMSIFQHVLSDRAAFEEFFDESAALVRKIERADASDPGAVRRDIHTLKGNCAIFGIESVARLCHELENDLDAGIESLTPAHRQALLAVWANVVQVRSQFSRDGGIVVERDEYRSFFEDLRGKAAHEALAARFASWQLEPASKRFELISAQLKQLAERLGKGPIEVRLEPTKVRLPPRKWAPLWAAFAHVLRNAIDHGLETPEERAQTNKPKVATVWLTLRRDAREVLLSVRDDGRGIDWDKIAERARALGLPSATAAELEAALFVDGVSSRTHVTTTSGRGVGLRALRDIVQQLGGRVTVRSERGMGTEFAIHLPYTMLVDDAVGVARSSAPPPADDRVTAAARARS